MIIEKDRLIFVHIQKTGGSAINAALGCERFPPHMHRTALELREIYGETLWQDCFKFAFVRNPWDRLVSWWSMIDGKRGQISSNGTHNKFFNYVIANATSFREFVLNCQDEIEDADGNKCILRNQLEYLVDSENKPIVDYVGRFEELNHGFSEVTKKIYGKEVSLPIVNSSNHREYQHYYDPETRNIVERAYERDINYFDFVF